MPPERQTPPPPGSSEEARALLLAILSETRLLHEALERNTSALLTLAQAGVHVNGGPGGGVPTMVNAVREALEQILDPEDEEPAPRRRRRRG